MANPRQRRKARSSSHHPVSHSKRAKRNLKKMPTIRGPKVLQDSWDKRKTVKQNYAALGLLSSLDPLASGGTEKNQEALMELSSSGVNDSNASATQPLIPQGFGRIMRDEAGNVIQIEVNEETQTSAKESTRTGMEQLDPIVDADVLAKWSISSRTRSNEHIGHVVEQLSTPQTASRTLSFALTGVGPRHASVAERCYLEKLVKKYGWDVDGMVRDHKLNPDQRTSGQLRNALRRAGL